MAARALATLNMAWPPAVAGISLAGITGRALAAPAQHELLRAIVALFQQDGRARPQRDGPRAWDGMRPAAMLNQMTALRARRAIARVCLSSKLSTAAPLARDALRHDRLDRRQLAERVDALQPEMVFRHVEHDADRAGVEGPALRARCRPAPSPARLHRRPGLRSSMRAHARAAGIAGLQQHIIDIDAAGVGEPDIAAAFAQDRRDHPRRRRLAVGAGDGDDRDAAATASRGKACRRSGSRHPWACHATAPNACAGPGAALISTMPPPVSADRLADVGRHEIDARHVEDLSCGRPFRRPAGFRDGMTSVRSVDVPPLERLAVPRSRTGSPACGTLASVLSWRSSISFSAASTLIRVRTFSWPSPRRGSSLRMSMSWATE